MHERRSDALVSMTPFQKKEKKVASDTRYMMTVDTR
jgi:hypothetical protein